MGYVIKTVYQRNPLLCGFKKIEKCFLMACLKAAFTCVRKLTDSHPKAVRQNAWFLLHVSVKSCVKNPIGLIDYHVKIEFL